MKIVVVLRPEEAGRIDFVGPFDDEAAANEWLTRKFATQLMADGKPAVTTHFVRLWDPNEVPGPRESIDG